MLTEIEEAKEGDLARLQRQLVEEVADGTVKKEIEGTEHLCPACQTLMCRNGKKRRRLGSKGDQVIELKREQKRCPACGMTPFPLDEKLGILRGHFTPRVQEAMTRLGSRHDYDEAREELELMWGVTVSLVPFAMSPGVMGR